MFENSDKQKLSAVINNVIAVKNLSSKALVNLIDAVDGIQKLSRRDQLQEGDTGGRIRNSTVGIILAVTEDTVKENLIVRKSIG